jgi:hypothetical protein
VNRYWLEVSTDSAFLVTDSDSSIIDTVKVLRGLSNGRRYWCRVCANNSVGWGPFGEARQFKVEWFPDAIPLSFNLVQNRPNPFNPTTVINYQIPAEGLVELKVFDVLGRETTCLVNETKTAGDYQVTFNGSSFSSGIYVYRLRLGERMQARKMVLIR